MNIRFFVEELFPVVASLMNNDRVQCCPFIALRTLLNNIEFINPQQVGWGRGAIFAPHRDQKDYYRMSH